MLRRNCHTNARIAMGSHGLDRPLTLRCPELLAVETHSGGDGVADFAEAIGGCSRDGFEFLRPAFTPYRHALRDRRSLGERAAELGITPSRRKVHEGKRVKIDVDEAGEG